MVRNFMARINLRSTLLHTPAGSVDEVAVALKTDVIEDLVDEQALARGGLDEGTSPDLHDGADEGPMQLSSEKRGRSIATSALPLRVVPCNNSETTVKDLHSITACGTLLSRER